MNEALSAREFVRIRDAAAALGVSEQTLRNWDRSGRLRAHRHPVNGYRLYRTGELRSLMQELSPQLELVERDTPDGDDLASLPPCHWSLEVALDPKHRPQAWGRPSSTVRRDWRKYPQEAHVIAADGRRYRRLLPSEIAILQGFDPGLVEESGLTDRSNIACVGDAVPPPVARALFEGVVETVPLRNRTSLEVCAGIGGLAEGAAHVELEHLALVDFNDACVQLLRRPDRPWPADRVHHEDVRQFDYLTLEKDVGILSGGPPCQPWSQSGHRLGRADRRDLFGWLPDLVSHVAPEIFVFENVPGLLVDMNRPYLEHLVERLRRPAAGLRYGVMVGRLNAADFGLPQVRQRIFFLGVRDASSATAHRCFDRMHSLKTHQDVTRGAERPWMTVGDALDSLPDPGGWRRWIGL